MKNVLRFTQVGLLASLLFAGCSQNTPPSHAKQTPSVSSRMAAEYDTSHKGRPTTSSAPAEQAAPARPKIIHPVATINDQPLARSEFLTLLMEARGVQMLQLMLVRDVARQEAKRVGAEVTPADIDEEYSITAKAEHLDGKDVGSMTLARREHIIDEWSRSRGVSRAELAVAIEKQAILRKIVNRQLEAIQFPEEQIQKEFRLSHGEKLLIRHIQFSNQRTYEQIHQRLEAGERFEDLVADYSQNVLTKMQQGLMQPLSPEDPTVPMLTKAAMQLKSGEVSNPIELDGYYHVLKLEKKIPPDDKKIEDVRDELIHNLRAQLVNTRIEELGRRLLMGAKLHIDDVQMAKLYADLQRTGRIDGPPLVGQ